MNSSADPRPSSMYDRADQQNGTAFIMIDLEGYIVDWSKQAESVFGWTSVEARGNLLGSLIIPERHRDSHWMGLEKYRETGLGNILNQRVELTALHRDGREFPVELFVSPTRLGESVYFCGVISSLHSKAAIEENTRQRAIESRLFQQATSRWSASDSYESALQDCVDVVCSMSGWPVGHALTVDPSSNRLVSADVWHLSDVESFEPVRRVSRDVTFARGEGFPGQVWAAGQTIWKGGVCDDPRFSSDDLVKIDLHGLFGFPIVVEGETVGVMEFFTKREIAPDPQLLMQVGSLSTLLARSMETRRWEEERLRLAAIVDSTYDAIFSKDANGIIMTWNPGAEYIFGYSAEEAIGKSIEIILPEGMRQEEPEIRRAMRTGRRLIQFETHRRRKDGTLIPVSLTLSPLRDSSGRIVGSSVIERDISGRLQRERELQQAKEQAESANRMKSEFLANISHELRTPMNAIIGMLELSLGEDLDPVIEDYLCTARDSADTLLYLLNDLLDFSRMEAGRFELEVEPFSIREVVEGTMRTLSIRAYEKGLELLGRVSPDVPDRLLGDGQRLNQILMNLVNNAIKFTEQGEVSVSLMTLDQSESHVTIHFAVADTGIGIAESDREAIFQPFTQLDATTTRQHTGTGLGLAICQELLQKMDSQLALESHPGQGSRFSFSLTLPVLNDIEADPNLVPNLSDLSVLVVDDNETNRLILEETLNGWNMQTTVLADPQEALDCLRQAQSKGNGYELVIVDALMPGIDGFTLIERLQEEGLSESATVLMLSSADRQTFKERCENLDIAAYLEKPISQSDMLDAVMTALQETRVDEAVVQRIPETPQPLDILVAEDTPANQKVIRAILNKRGHRVEIAHNGREAIELHRHGDFDLILMDVQMPTIDGLQATEAIRSMHDPEKASVPIIAMTAHARRKDRLKCLKAGMNSYIAKPIDTQRLLEMIESLRREVDSSRSVPVKASREDDEAPKRVAKESLVNREAALARLNGSEDLLHDLMTYFLEDAPGLLQAANDAIAEGNAKVVERSAHSLRGLAANFDAEQVVVAASRLEDIGRSGSLSTASAAFSQLRQAVADLSDELRAEV